MVGCLTEQTEAQDEEGGAPRPVAGTNRPTDDSIVVELTAEQAESIRRAWKPEDRHRPRQFVLRADNQTVGVLHVISWLVDAD
ncbi:MAG TPA: hypothetical protein VHF27_01690 [Acidimicrobiales bacterium]|nr:hypothetical protein [Acidimicrobiales bacterium]